MGTVEIHQFYKTGNRDYGPACINTTVHPCVALLYAHRYIQQRTRLYPAENRIINPAKYRPTGKLRTANDQSLLIEMMLLSRFRRIAA